MKKLNPYKIETLTQAIRIDILNDVNELRHERGQSPLPIKLTEKQIKAMEKF